MRAGERVGYMQHKTQGRLSAGLAVLVGGAAAASQGWAQPITTEDVVVVANRTPTEAAKVGSSVSVIGQSELAEAGPFLLGALARVPGLAISQTGGPGASSGFAIRGMNQNYVVVRVDGIEVGDPSAPQVTASLSDLLASDVAEVEVLKGAQSALYGGRAAGGVIDITTARPDVPGVETRVAVEGGSFGTKRGAVTIAGRGQRGDFALSFGRVVSDGFSAAEEADGNTEADGYRTSRLSASGNFALTERVTLSAAGFWQDSFIAFDEFGGPGGDGTPGDDFAVATSRGLRLGARIDGATSHEMAVSHYRIDRDSYFNGFPFSPVGERTKLEYQGEASLSPTLGLVWGADWTRETSRSNFSAAQAASIAGAFAQFAYAPSETLTVTAALRHDRQSEFGGYTSGRLTAAHALDPDTLLRAAIGTGFRPPSINELTYGPNGANLTPETSVSADLGIERRVGTGTITATAFYVATDEEIIFDFTANAPFGDYIQVPGTTRRQGLELGYSADLTPRLRFDAAYTYTDTETEAGGRVPRVPRHDMSLALGYQATPRLDVSVTARRVMDTVDIFDAVLDDYTLVGARLSYAITDAVAVTLRAENLLDEQYQTADGYSTADRSAYLGLEARF